MKSLLEDAAVLGTAFLWTCITYGGVLVKVSVEF